ncbi:MAG: tetratricopeptide repeat protein [Candidatus Caldatribacteriaceae bacterium]
MYYASYNRGVAHYVQKHYEQAMADFTKAIEGGEAGGYYGLALTYEALHAPQKALKAYQQFVHLAPSGYEEELQFARKRIEALPK